MTILAIDQGTPSSRAILFDADPSRFVRDGDTVSLVRRGNEVSIRVLHRG